MLFRSHHVHGLWPIVANPMSSSSGPIATSRVHKIAAKPHLFVRHTLTCSFYLLLLCTQRNPRPGAHDSHLKLCEQ